MRGSLALEKTERLEKNRVTLISVLASFALTAAKLTAGLLTGSLGLIAEAAHSGLDTVASLITLFSVRFAGRPADENHPYGHGRFENLSAVIQGVLLLGTAAWILFESIRRIFFVSVPVEPTVWAFVVMGAAIALDFWRSRMLLRTARKYRSRALEADALNFRADMFSSGVVILGLALVAYGKSAGAGGPFLKADAWAAALVGLIIIFKSGQLALKSVNVLLDLAPVELQERITRSAGSVPGVVGTRLVRLRESGNRKFADIVVDVPRTLSAAEAHDITERVEAAVRDIDPGTESVVHTEPVTTTAETAAEAVRATALGMGVRTHHERVQRLGDHFEASLHVEVDADLSLGEAHELTRWLSAGIRKQNPQLTRVNTHIEVAEPDPSERRDVTEDHVPLAEEIRRAVGEFDAGARCHEVRLYRSEERGLDAILHCDFPSSTNIGEVHLRTEQIEQALRNHFSPLENVVIHAEPREQRGEAPEL